MSARSRKQAKRTRGARQHQNSHESVGQTVADQPVDAEIRRAATRMGLRAAEPKAPRELTGDDRAALAKLEEMDRSAVPLATELVKVFREAGASNDRVSQALRHQAHGLRYLAERLTPDPETRDAMLEDALAVVAAAESIFQHQGCDDVLTEALRAASDDLELFEYASSGPAEVDPMAYLRAQNRIDLALKLADFRRKHPTWKPVKAEGENDRAKQPAGGAA